MKFEEFFEIQNRFVGLSPNEQICRVAWYLHRHLGQDRLSPKMVSDQFREAHLNPPQTSVYLPRLVDKRPALMLKDKRGYFLEGRERKRLDDILQPNKTTAPVSNLLRSLNESIADGPERIFFDEALRCYEVAAFRAAIVMTWNLAYNHLRKWVALDEARLQSFNDGATKRFQKNPKPIVKSEVDFDEFKESEFIDACSSGKVITKNLETMLREKLRRRNMAAHPSVITILQPQADDVISDLVRNVIISL